MVEQAKAERLERAGVVERVTKRLYPFEADSVDTNFAGGVAIAHSVIHEDAALGRHTQRPKDVRVGRRVGLPKLHQARDEAPLCE